MHGHGYAYAYAHGQWLWAISQGRRSVVKSVGGGRGPLVEGKADAGSGSLLGVLTSGVAVDVVSRSEAHFL